MRGNERISLFKFGDVRSFLGELFRRRCLRNRNYSLRAFARDCTVSNSSMARVMAGQTAPRQRFLEAIAAALDMNASEKQYLFALEKSGQEETLLRLRRESLYQKSPEVPNLELSLHELSLVIVASLWDGFYLKDLIPLFSRHTECALEAACERLRESGWLHEEAGHYTAPYGFLHKDQDSVNRSVRIFHRHILEAGLQKLDSIPVQQRFFFSTLFSLSHDAYEHICREIETFVLKHSDAIKSREEHDRIYALGVQLLPMTDPFPSRQLRRESENPNPFGPL